MCCGAGLKLGVDGEIFPGKEGLLNSIGLSPISPKEVGAILKNYKADLSAPLLKNVLMASHCPQIKCDVLNMDQPPRYARLCEGHTVLQEAESGKSGERCEQQNELKISFLAEEFCTILRGAGHPESIKQKKSHIRSKS